MIPLRTAENMVRRGKAHLDHATLTLRLIDQATDVIRAGRTYKRIHQAPQQVNREVILDVKPVDPDTVPTNRIGLPVIPHYAGRSLDDFLANAAHIAGQKSTKDADAGYLLIDLGANESEEAGEYGTLSQAIFAAKAKKFESYSIWHNDVCVERCERRAS